MLTDREPETALNTPSSMGPGDLRLPAAVAIGGVLLFSVLALALVAAGPSNSWDVELDAALRSFRHPVLDEAMYVATYLCAWQVIVAGLIGALAYLLVAGKRLAAAALFVSVVGDQVIVSALKSFFDRARPDQLAALLPAAGPSFPSGHTFAAIAFYGVLTLIATEMIPSRALRGVAAATAMLFVVAVGFSRIYLGAHWPSDVLGSWLLGTAWLAVIGILLKLARSRFPLADRRVTARTD